MQASLPHPDSRAHHAVLMTAAPEARELWASVFAHEALAGWAVAEADSLEQAHFALQHGDHDVWVVDDQLCQAGEGNGLGWLAYRRQTPVLVLADPEPGRLARLCHAGCEQWLARDLGQQPELLAIALRQAVRLGELRRQLRRQGDELRDCRQRVNRLADMLWASVGEEGRGGWLTQPHLMLRLQEEMDRADRHATPLTLVLGEVSSQAGPSEGPGAAELVAWAAGLINQTKRRCDVAGRYGRNSFLMLLVQTPATGAAVFCDRLRRMLRDRPPAPPGADPPVRVSFGLAAHVPGFTPTHLLSLAEENLEQTRQTTEPGA